MIDNKNIMNKVTLQFKKQKGATLITALMMLLVMTILGIAAVKMTSIDILVAGNDQQRLMLMQETETDLNNLTTPSKLVDPLIGEPVNGVEAAFDVNGIYNVLDPRNPLAVETITELRKVYDCIGVGGKATSVGNKCQLYDFQVRARRALGGAREIRRRGAGKEVPDSTPYSTL